MIKKILVPTAILFSVLSFPSMAYVYGGSNLSIMGYPSFSGYVSYEPSYDEMQRYLSDVKEYVENCDNDIQRIIEARDEAIRKANQKVQSYNMTHNLY